ncbi:MAG: hypothetical protein M3Z29_07140 [Pseudomonadota bacterium]|nr:hypothetical protein [Pseudomonadota bacterium]
MNAFVVVALLAWLGLLEPARAESSAPMKIYSCVGKDGKRYKSDRLNAECLDRDQQELNADGSPRRIVPRARTEDEKAADELKQRQLERDRAAKQRDQRRDMNLLNRYPGPAAHDKARQEALEGVQTSINQSKKRQALLEADRKKLADQAEFYVGKHMPVTLRNALDANDAALNAQAALIANQQQEIGRINKLFDEELKQLKKLWSA